jgi:hypothetical protein
MGEGCQKQACHKTSLLGARVETQEDSHDTACNCTQSSHHPGLSMDRVTRQVCNRTGQLLDRLNMGQTYHGASLS